MNLVITIAAIQALGGHVYDDALRAAMTLDLSGLAYIANMANGLHGTSYVKLGFVCDLAEALKNARELTPA